MGGGWWEVFQCFFHFFWCKKNRGGMIPSMSVAIFIGVRSIEKWEGLHGF